MPIFENSYLNEFVTKRCKNFTFAVQIFLQYEIQNCSTTRAKTLKVMTG